MNAWKSGIVFTSLWLLCLSTGCDSGTARAKSSTGAPLSNPLPLQTDPNSSPEVFDAITLRGVGPGMVTIETDLKAQIDVVTYPADEVGVDYVTQGWGNSDEAAAAEAHHQVAVTLERVAGGALIWGRLLTPAANAQDKISLLHVRVPHNSSLVIKATKGGDITVSGEVLSVHAHTTEGTITVKGVTGPVQLTTERGSINVDTRSNMAGQAQPVELHARNGNLSLISVGVSVLADTTGGNISFVGSLFGNDNRFSTTGDGKVVLALPNDIPYGFTINSGGRVVNDFMPATLVCGVMTNTSTNLQLRPSPDSVGAIIASDPIVTPTYTFNGATGTYRNASQIDRPYLYFETNHSQVTRLSPSADASSAGANAAQLWWSQECDTARQQFNQTSVHFHVRTERGSVFMRLIRKHE